MMANEIQHLAMVAGVGYMGNVGSEPKKALQCPFLDNAPHALWDVRRFGIFR